MSSTNADLQIKWRKAAQADTLVHMYEDGLPVIGDPSIYLATTVSDRGESNHQPWHFNFYYQLRTEIDWKHPILIPEQRKSGGNRKGQQSAWRRQALAQADHLVFNFEERTFKKEQAQLYQQIDLALGRKGDGIQPQIWIVSKLGLDFNEATENTLKQAGIFIFKDFSQIGNELFAFA